MENGDKGQGKKEVFIIYLNDDDKITSAYVELIECDGFVVFKTGQNIIRIPRERVLKIKEKIENER